MGGSVAKLIGVERTSWSKPHNLETNETYAVQQREIIDKFFKVVTPTPTSTITIIIQGQREHAALPEDLPLGIPRSRVLEGQVRALVHH